MAKSYSKQITIYPQIPLDEIKGTISDSDYEIAERLDLLVGDLRKKYKHDIDPECSWDEVLISCQADWSPRDCFLGREVCTDDIEGFEWLANDTESPETAHQVSQSAKAFLRIRRFNPESLKAAYPSMFFRCTIAALCKQTDGSVMNYIQNIAPVQRKAKASEASKLGADQKHKNADLKALEYLAPFYKRFIDPDTEIIDSRGTLIPRNRWGFQTFHRYLLVQADYDVSVFSTATESKKLIKNAYHSLMKTQLNRGS